MATRKTAPVKGLEDYTFEKSEEYWPGRVIKQHGWTNTRTGDWATKFPTKAEAVKAARRFEKGLRAEERGVVGTRQFRGASEKWLRSEIERIEEAQKASDVDQETRCYRAGLIKGYEAILKVRSLDKGEDSDA